MHRYDKQGLICQPHPTKMPAYIVAAGLALTAVFGAAHVYKNLTSTSSDCDISDIPSSEIVQGACNHPVPKP